MANAEDSLESVFHSEDSGEQDTAQRGSSINESDMCEPKPQQVNKLIGYWYITRIGAPTLFSVEC
jgi:hypothetical protein